MGFKNEIERVKYKDRNGKPITKELTEQYPFFQYVSVFDIMFDPTVDNFYNSKYVIRRRASDHIDDITARYSAFIPNIRSLVMSAKDEAYVIPNDYNRIKFAMVGDNLNETIKVVTKDTENVLGIDFLSNEIKNQLTLGQSDEYFEIFEYWEKRKFALVVNGKVVYSGKNPFPVEKIPFVQMLSNKVP